MSDTPQTDAEEVIFSPLARDRWVRVGFARQLERERDDAKGKYATEATEHMLAVNKLCNERDEARNAIVGWETKWKCAIDMAARAERERDEALEDAKKYHIKMVNLMNERNDTRELAQQMSESNQVLQAEVRDYRKKEKANPFYKY